MEKSKAQAACAILKEIETLEKYKKVPENAKHKEAVHFELCPHYSGSCNESDKVLIPSKFNSAFYILLDSIILELKTELEKL